MHEAEKCEETGSLKSKVGIILGEGVPCSEIEKDVEVEMIRSFVFALYQF